LRAAYELQSRLYNILPPNTVLFYPTSQDEREANYVVDHTAFPIGQYFVGTQLLAGTCNSSTVNKTALQVARELFDFQTN
jgi:hypothetical protein